MNIFRLFPAILTIASLAADLPRPAGAADRPNIRFLFSDDHAVKSISAYGGPLAEVAPTPGIDRLAKDVAPFTDLIFNAAPRYQFKGNLVVRENPKWEGEIPVPESSRKSSPLAGWSAIGYAFPGQSEFTPLLELADSQGRRAGWAAGLLRHIDGEFKGGSWMLVGVENPDFYRDAAFKQWMIETVRSSQVEDGSDSVQQISINQDGHFVKADGSRFFVMGSNYLGPFDAKMGTFFEGESFSAEALDTEFSKAHESGINLLRSFSFGNLPVLEIPGRVTVIREAARKHGIHLLPEIGIKGELSRGPIDLRDLGKYAGAVAKAWRDEPFVLGYDLANEPYLTQVGALTFYGKPSPIVALRPYETKTHLMKKWWVDQQMEDTAE